MRIGAIVAALALAGVAACSQDVTPQSGSASAPAPKASPATGATAQPAQPAAAPEAAPTEQAAQPAAEPAKAEGGDEKKDEQAEKKQ